MKNLLIAICILAVSAVSILGQNDIRKVDFKNFTYLAYCLGESPTKIAVKDGEFSSEKQEEGYVDRFYFKVFDIAYGDLNGDGRDEAIILTVCNMGGTGNFSEGFIFTMKAGKPSLVARIPGGDRADGGLRTTRVENGLLVVESNAQGPEGGACCPQFIITTKYKVVGSKLQQSGRPLQESIDRTERIRFGRGESGTTFKAYIAASESKKFVLGARAGQSLIVSVSGAGARVRLLTPATINATQTRFMAALPKSGDYTFEVFNDSTTEDDITITVKIN